MLPADWWIRWRDREPVQSALVRAHCVHWAGCVDEILGANERSGIHPRDWKEIARAIYRETKNVGRWYRGRQYNYAPLAYLALAGVLRIEVSELIPGNVRWLANTIRLLCDNGCSTEDCRVLAACCLLQSGPQPLDLSSSVIAAAAEQCGNGNDLDRLAQLTIGIHDQLHDQLQQLSQ